jgi:hypothetical protein
MKAEVDHIVAKTYEGLNVPGHARGAQLIKRPIFGTSELRIAFSRQRMIALL